MVCPKCGGKLRSTNSRKQGTKAMGDNIVYRRKECQVCGERVTTVERIWEHGMGVSRMVKLADGSDENKRYELWICQKGGSEE